MEKEFGKEIPNIDAENLSTIGDVSLWFYDHLNKCESDRNLESQLFERLKEALKDIGVLHSDLKMEDHLDTIIPKGNCQAIWKELESSLSLQIPELNRADFLSEAPQPKKILGLTIQKPKPSFLENNVNRLVECIGALNYKKLIDFTCLSTLFEVKIVVMSITSKCLGVDIKEVFWDTSFTNDLGAN